MITDALLSYLALLAWFAGPALVAGVWLDARARAAGQAQAVARSRAARAAREGATRPRF